MLRTLGHIKEPVSAPLIAETNELLSISTDRF